MALSYDAIDLETVPGWRTLYAYDRNELFQNLGIVYEVLEDHISTLQFNDTLQRSKIVPIKTSELVFNRSGGWSADELLFVYTSTGRMTLPQDLFGAAYRVIGGPLNGVLTLYKEDTAIGTITFVNSVATFVLGTDIPFAKDDILQVKTGSDATFSYLSITLLAKRPIANT